MHDKHRRSGYIPKARPFTFLRNPMISTTKRFPYLADGHILGLSALLTLPVAIFAPKGLAVLFALSALLSLVSGFAHLRETLVAMGWGVRLAAAFTALSLASALWSMTPGTTVKKALILGLVLFCGLILTCAARRLQGKGRRMFETGLIFGGVLGFAALAIEIYFGGPLFQLLWGAMGIPPQPASTMLRAVNQGAAVAAIFLLPWALAVRRRKGTLWASIGFAVCVVVLAFGQADSQKAALIVGLAAVVLVFIGGKPALKGLSALFVVGVLSAPWVVPVLPDPLDAHNSAAGLPNSTQHRLVIWQTTARLIFKKPLAGSGFDTSRAFYNKDQKAVYIFGGEDSPARWFTKFEPIPLHPHNGILQIWLELGALGAILMAAVLYYITNRLSAFENRFERAVIFGSFVTGLVIFSISYGAWQSWWMGAIWLLTAFGAAFMNDSKGQEQI
jgi:exopolysaccharide production protein ExoQ